MTSSRPTQTHPTRHWLALGLSVLSLPLLISPALASTYRSASRATYLVLNETTAAPKTGFYFTTANGRQWMGTLQITGQEGAMGHSYYSGTFKDSTTGPGPRNTCQGDIRLTRTSAGRGPEMQMTARWTITGGENCPTVGQTVALSLTEPLPVADRNGDYMPRNANTAMSETSGEYTWPAWLATSADGKLNCRATPNGAVKFTYRSGDRIDVADRSGNAFDLSSGSPWLRTTKGCLIRASNQLVKPVSVPF